MAAVSKAYGVGDTVYVYYKNSSSLRFLPQSRVVSNVKVDSSGNSARVEFTNGDAVTDVSTAQTVFTTQALCANAIIDDVLTDYDACAVLNSTTSGASTASQPTLGLARNSN